MAGNEIIKVLECCTKGRCAGWPANKNNASCLTHLAKHALGLINRQKADIEKLEIVKKHIDTLICRECDYSTAEAYNSSFQKALEQIHDNANARAEAIKEFAERLKEEYPADGRYQESTNTVIRIFHSTIDNLVKEMVGEGK